MTSDPLPPAPTSQRSLTAVPTPAPPSEPAPPRRRRPPQWGLIWLLGDLAVGAAAFYGAFLIRIHLPLPLTVSLLPSDRLVQFFGASALVLSSQPVFLYFFGFYDTPRPRPRLDLLRGLSSAVLLQSLSLMAFYFLSRLIFPRTVLLLFPLLNGTGLFLFRSLLQRFYRPGLLRVAIVGSNAAAQELAENINAHHWHGLHVVGYVQAPTDIESVLPRHGALGPRLGELGDVSQLLAEHQVDSVILASSSYDWQTQLLDQLSGQPAGRGSVLLLPSPFESMIGRTRYRTVRDLPLIEVIRESEWHSRHPTKRFFDVLVSSFLLLLATPVLAVCAFAIRITSGRPIFYRQTRLGRDLEPFSLWKLRTMKNDAEAGDREQLARPHDPRLTPLGATLRRYRLDEMPQLLNVLRGDMSLVGPRPERPGFVSRYRQEVPGYVERFSVRPGLTGLAQVNGDYHSSAQNKLRYDLAYIANWSLWLDFSILFRTIKIVLTSGGT